MSVRPLVTTYMPVGMEVLPPQNVEVWGFPMPLQKTQFEDTF